MTQSFEVKKHAVRQTADGWIMSFVVHPSDMTAEFAVAPLGTRYMLALAEIADDETTEIRDPAPTPVSRSAAETDIPPQSAPNSLRPGAHTKDLARSMAGKQRYAELDEPHKLAAKAAILAQDPRFQTWCGFAGDGMAAKQWIRGACGVNSCAEFAHSRVACERFRGIVTEYDLESGRLPEIR